MAINWPRFRDLVDEHDRFVLTTHVRPDPDALGSELALAGLLRQRGKEVRIVNASATPPRFQPLDAEGHLLHLGTDVQAGDLDDAEVLVVLDTSAWGQLGEMADVVRRTRAVKAVVDHHVSQDDLGAELFKDTTAEATGVLVFEAAPHLDAQITPEIAQALFAAIAMDTGWFRFSSTRPRTFHVAADLLSAGARQDELYRQLFERDTLERLKLAGVVLERMQLACNGRVAYTSVKREDFQRTGAIPPDTEDLVNYTLTLAGVEVGLFFVEQLRGGVKISFRSRTDVDCSRLAEAFGGGGHRQAAGAVVADPLEQAQRSVLAAVEAALIAGTNC